MSAPVWTTEPDVDVFDARGFPCHIKRHPSMGYLCGYVGVAPEHPLFHVGYSDEAPSLAGLWERRKQRPIGERASVVLMIGAVFGGEDLCRNRPDCTFMVHGGITYAGDRVPGEAPDGRWWFGFDCAHAGDLQPGSPFRPLPGDEYRDMEYVRAECRSLAEQLAEVTP